MLSSVAVMDIILIAGMWLDGRAWAEVVPFLEEHGHRAVTMTLPGQGASTEATLDDQITAVTTAIDDAHGPVMVVGHSGACTLAWLAADRRVDKVAKVAMIGGFPEAEGAQYFGYFEPKEGQVTFPGWEPFEGDDAGDLDVDMRAHMESISVPVAEGVTSSTVHYTDPRHNAVPMVLVCPEYTPEQAKEWVASGDVPELQNAADLTYADIDSGHWPMFSKPKELADLLAGLAGSVR